MHSRCASIPALAVTALGQPEDLKRTHEAGFAEHVVKPFDVDDLEHRIRTLLADNRSACHSRTTQRQSSEPPPDPLRAGERHNKDP
jgi:DNA-binding response OmpR family regulator